MKSEYAPNDEALHDQLSQLASDVPDVEGIRTRVFDALEADASAGPNVRSPRFRKKYRPLAAVAAVAAVFAVAIVLMPREAPQSENVSVIGPSETTEPTLNNALTSQIRNGRIDTGAIETLLNEEKQGGDDQWEVLEVTESVISLELVGNATEVGSDAQILRIATPPLGASTADIVESLTRSLFGTEIVSDSTGSVGGLETRTLRLETTAGTTQLGFRIAEDTYLTAQGTDRVFLVHMPLAQPGSPKLVFWLEAPAESIDTFEPVALQLLSSLTSD